MRVVKIRRDDGLHCFYCNARVEDKDERCPGCGRELVAPGEERTTGPGVGSARRSGRLGERIRLANKDRRRGYKLAVFVLAALAVVSGLVFRGRGSRLEFPRPEAAEVSGRVLETREHPAGRIERRSVFALVRPGLPVDSLRAALDWLIYRTVDERNRVERGNLRVVWVYLYEEESVPVTGWRAMAIWQAPGLPEAVRPAGIGADAFRVGDVQYMFSNRLESSPGGVDGR